MNRRQHTDADRQRRHRTGQLSIRRRCACGRELVGNAAWWSHLNAGKPGCGPTGGRA